MNIDNKGSRHLLAFSWMYM